MSRCLCRVTTPAAVLKPPHSTSDPFAGPPPPIPNGLVAVLFLGTLVAAFDIALVGPTLRTIGTHFGLTERATSWVLTVFVLANLAGQPLMAWMGDVSTRRMVFLGCLALFATGTVVVVSASTFPALLSGRVVQGLGASGLFPMASAVVGDVYPREQRGRVLGVLGAVFGIAFLAGPVMAGVLLQYSWRAVFAATLPLSAGVFVAAYRVFPSIRPAQPRPLDAVGIALLVGGLLALAMAANLVRAVATGLPRWVAPLLGLAAALLLAGFALQQRRTPYPLMRPALMARRQVRLAACFAVGAGLVEAVFVFLPGYAQAAFGVDRSEAAFMLMPLVLALTIGAPLAGRLLDWVGSRLVLGVGAGVLAFGLGTLAFAEPSRSAYYGGTVLVGLGLSGMLGSSLSYILLNEAAAHERAVAQSLVTVFLGSGQIMGAAFIGALVAAGAHLSGFSQAFTAVFVVALLLVGASFALAGRAQERHPEPSPQR